VGLIRGDDVLVARFETFVTDGALGSGREREVEAGVSEGVVELADATPLLHTRVTKQLAVAVLELPGDGVPTAETHQMGGVED